MLNLIRKFIAYVRTLFVRQTVTVQGANVARQRRGIVTRNKARRVRNMARRSRTFNMLKRSGKR